MLYNKVFTKRSLKFSFISGGDHGRPPAVCEDRVTAAAGVPGHQGGGGAAVGHVATRGHGHPWQGRVNIPP